MVGLDIKEKTKMVEIQMRKSFGEKRLSKFTTFALTINGSVPEDPRNQASALVDVRLVVQSQEEEALATHNFLRPALDIIMWVFLFDLDCYAYVAQGNISRIVLSSRSPHCTTPTGRLNHAHQASLVKECLVSGIFRVADPPSRHHP